jgi:hypothetical protein
MPTMMQTFRIRSQEILQRENVNVPFAKSLKCRDSGLPGAKGGNTRYSMTHGRRANSSFVGSSSPAAWGVDDQVNLIIGEHVENIGTSFVNFPNGLDRNTILQQDPSGARGPKQSVTYVM